MDPAVTFRTLTPLEIGGFVVEPMVWLTLVIFVVSFGAAACAILFLGHRLRRSEILSQPLPGFDVDDDCTLVFLGRKLWSASDAAQAFLANLPDAPDAWSQLHSHLQSDGDSFADDLNSLDRDGVAFSAVIHRGPGNTLSVKGQPRGRFVAVRISRLDAEQSHRVDTDTSLARAGRVVDTLEAFRHNAPLLLWQRDTDGLVHYANANALDTLGVSGSGWTLPEVFRTDCATEGKSTRRSAFRPENDGEQTWFEVLEVSTEAGDIIGYANNIDSLVRTEAALQRFISTLTETFAQLPVGLSIFDAERTLSLFNPALIDLLGFDPAHMARRPSLREFFDILRENRMVPGQKNFGDWRQYVVDVQNQAEAGTLREKLVLPSGRTFEITGRPHPHGAIALIFEDITSLATLEQRYRSEIELSQATLDQLTEAVCVFDTAGALVFANVAFADLWGFDPMEGLEPIRIVDATRIWIDKSLPTPVWGDVRDFATRSEDRCQWHAEIDLIDGRRLNAGFSPLPDGSSLIVFSDITDEARRNANHQTELERAEKSGSGRHAVMTFAIDRMREAVLQVGTDLRDGSLSDPATVEAILASAVKQADDILKLDERPRLADAATIGAMIIELGHIAEAREIDLDFSMDQDLTPLPVSDDLRRLLLNMVMAGGEVLDPGSNAQVSLVPIDDGLAISFMGSLATSAGEPANLRTSLPLRLMERITTRMEGTLTITPLDGRNVKIACTVPTVMAQRGSGDADDLAIA